MMQIGNDKVVKVMMGTNVLFENTWKEIPYDGLFSKFGSIKYFDFDNRIFFKGEFTQEMVNAISTRNFNFPFFKLPEEFHNPHFLSEYSDSNGFYMANLVVNNDMFRIHRKGSQIYLYAFDVNLKPFSLDTMQITFDKED